MSEQMTPEEITSFIQAATQEVFSTMLNLPIENLAPYQETECEPPASMNGVEALVGMAGTWNGTGRICCSSHFACRLAGAMLMSEYEALNDDVLDAVAEVANMVIGNVKTRFEERVGPLGLSIPTVVFGRNYHTRSAGVQSWIVVPFDSGGDLWQVRLCLIPARNPSHPHPHHTAPKVDSLQSA
jgi:chemotaxis protein CheX